jgi:hypothetical protein
LPIVANNVLRQNQHFMPKRSFTHRRPSRASQPSAETTVSPSSSVVEEIWSSWRYDKLAPRSEGKTTNETSPGPWTLRAKSATSAELVHQLKWQGRYEQALQIALSEIEREEQESSLRGFDRQSIPWYYWEAAAIYRKLKRHSDEIALIPRFANNHNIHFRAFSKRYRSTRAATYAWATKFLDRIDAARSAAAHAEKEKRTIVT